RNDKRFPATLKGKWSTEWITNATRRGKKGLLRKKQALGGFLPRACRFDAYPVPYSRVDDRRKAR
ncbi:MAG TPA: hypothetical protein VFI76_00965, partial [Terrimicrobiaceae bacterium]|nr:hypothetical protein [Terrimicrobiaceae bacterium]